MKIAEIRFDNYWKKYQYRLVIRNNADIFIGDYLPFRKDDGRRTNIYICDIFEVSNRPSLVTSTLIYDGVVAFSEKNVTCFPEYDAPKIQPKVREEDPQISILGIRMWMDAGQLKNTALAINKLTKYAKDGVKEAFYPLGRLYEDDGEYETALKWYLKGAEAGDLDALFGAEDICYRGYTSNADYDKAYPYLLSALIKNKNDGAILNDIGLHFLGLNKFNRAIAYFNKAIKSKNNIAYINLGLTYECAGRYLDAKRYYQKAIKLGVEGAEERLQELEDEYNV